MNDLFMLRNKMNLSELLRRHKGFHRTIEALINFLADHLVRQLIRNHKRRFVSGNILIQRISKFLAESVDLHIDFGQTVNTGKIVILDKFKLLDRAPVKGGIQSEKINFKLLHRSRDV